MFSNSNFNGDLSRWKFKNLIDMTNFFETSHYNIADLEIPDDCIVYHNSVSIRLPLFLENIIELVLTDDISIKDYLTKYPVDFLKIHIQKR